MAYGAVGPEEVNDGLLNFCSAVCLSSSSTTRKWCIR